MARKSVSFGQLLEYINAPEKTGQTLLHNLQARNNDLGTVRGEFIANAHLLPPRKNGNVLYHEILSFGADDSSSVSPAILEDLARRYLDLRAPQALAYAKAHFDTECAHVHVIISANNVGSHQRLRLSKQRFRHIQREVEQYQKERYPYLVHSLAQERQRSGIRETRSEQDRHRRGEQSQSRKKVIRELIASELTVARSGPDCYRRLLKHGLRLYRRGKAIGAEDLEDCRRYRLKTLGLVEAFERSMAAWKRLPEFLQTDTDLVRAQRRQAPKHQDR